MTVAELISILQTVPDPSHAPVVILAEPGQAYHISQIFNTGGEYEIVLVPASPAIDQDMVLDQGDHSMYCNREVL